ncbi:unnamed protein product [Rotaria sordida]|uniref:Uncharacterized protein n=1 Tax=Rotaria sordida TaxID=392033 RepID=A0A814NBL3_9BILA|nr:unnamed protein product [Rotaria sordida]
MVHNDSFSVETRSFQCISQFSKISKRQTLTAYVDPVDASNFPVLQKFIRNILTKWSKVPRSVIVHVEEAYIDFSDNTLYMLGNYIFSIFCKESCQNHIINSPLIISGQIQTLNNFSIFGLNIDVRIMIHKNINNLRLRSLSFVSENLTDPIIFKFTMRPTSKILLHSQRRQVANTNENESVYKLIRQMLGLTNKVRNISFIITDFNLAQGNGSPQLFVTVRLRHPIYCTTTCIDEIIDDLFETLLGSSQINGFTYTNGITTYIIDKIDLIGVGRSAPASFFILSYPIENMTNITEGPITDRTSLINIKSGIEQSLSPSRDTKVLRASFAREETSMGKALSVERRIRRQRQIRYLLIVIIRGDIFKLLKPQIQTIQGFTLSSTTATTSTTTRNVTTMPITIQNLTTAGSEGSDTTAVQGTT